MTAKATKTNALHDLSAKAGDELQIEYIALSSLADKFLGGNSKKHSMSDLSDSIQKYDFQDPIKYDPALNDGNGGIVFGNGRLEWLCHAKSAGQPAPRGIREKEGEWYVPVLFGVEFATEEEAIAFSISHNLSPLWGADGFTFLDSAKLFSQDLLEAQLTELADMSIDLLPVGISGDDLDLLLGLNEPEPENPKLPDPGDAEETEIEKQWGVIVFCDDEQEQVELIDSLINEGKRCKALM